MVMLWGRAFAGSTWRCSWASTLLCAFGTTIGFHRYFTHKGFEARAPVKITLRILGCMTMQGPIIQWVTDHRKHHALSDKPGDPTRAGLRRPGSGDACRLPRARRLDVLEPRDGAGPRVRKDLYGSRDRVRRGSTCCGWRSLGIRFSSGTSSGAAHGCSVSRRSSGAGSSGSSSTSATFSVNSICHMFGRKDYVSRDEARNNWIVALLVFGEGWHNNHHAFPRRHDTASTAQVDVSWWVIRTMERARLVRNVKTPSGDQLARRRLLPSES